MKIKIFLLIFVSINLFAQNLSEITEAFKKSKKVTSMKEQSKSDIAHAELTNSYEAPYLGLNISHADESGDKGSEYAIGVSQDIAHPFANSNKDAAVEAKSRAIEQGAAYAIDILTLDIEKIYHQACVSKEMSQSLQRVYDEQSESFLKLRKAYEFGEISKKELLFNKLDLAKTKQRVTTYKREYISELSNLQEAVESLEIGDLVCNDLMKITKEIELKGVDEHSLIKELSYEQKEAKSFYDMYNPTLSAIGYELLYEKELGASRYTFGISVPLDFSSSKAQIQRAEYLHKNASLLAKKDALIIEIQNSLMASKKKLKTLYEEFVLLDEEILPMSLELKDLAKKSLYEGHSSVLKFLDATRSYSNTTIELQEIKKDYYNELFELYKKADMRGKL